MKADLNPTPYLSIVVTCRNDDHGSNFIRRVRLFMKGLIHQSNKHKVNIELIVVEWNPVPGIPYLKDVLPAPSDSDFLKLRYIVVPPEIHNRYKCGPKLGLFQMIAKNVGIRRANAPFVLCTNVDLLFPDALFRILAKKQLKPDRFYRTYRIDVKDGFSEAMSFEDQIAFARKNVLQIQKNPRIIGLLPRLLLLPRKTILWLNKKLPGLMFSQLETFACGDFTLMSKSAWEEIEGYPELDLYSIHIDSLGIISALALGYRQVLLPKKASPYHIDHKSGWASMSPKEKIEFCQEKPCLGWDFAYLIGIESLRTNKAYNINKEDWGYKNNQFKEFTFN